MSIPFNPPVPIQELTPELKESLKTRMEKNLCQLVKKLSVLGSCAPGKPLDFADMDDQLGLKFASSVPFTTYDDYFPYSSIFFNSSCLVSDVVDLLAPGLPVFIAHTSGTSGAAVKYFPKYPNPLYCGNPRWDTPEAQKTMGRITMCQFGSLAANRLVHIQGRDGESVPSIPVTIVSSGGLRSCLGIGPNDDADIVDKKASFMTSPFAAWLLPTYNANIYVHAFFGVLDKSVSFMVGPVPTMICDAISTIEENWDLWISCIDNGRFPDIPDLGDNKARLQAHLKPNPKRASELREIEKGKEGWLKEIWPSLTIPRVPLSGAYAMSIRKLQHHFGPIVNLQSAVYAATECMVGFGYSTQDTNLYRLDSNEHIELLDVEKEPCIHSLSQAWEVEVGKRYEVAVTSNDGLWRYMLTDIVEVAGFSPTDGQPLIKYIERKGVGFRVWGEFLSQSVLEDAVGSISAVLGNIVEFTVEIDERKKVRGHGFFIEIDGELISNSHLARVQLKERLSLNEGYKYYSESGHIEDPTIRIVAPGTFSAYREWRIKMTGSVPGQTKVPCTITDVDTKQWFTKKVIMEL